MNPKKNWIPRFAYELRPTGQALTLSSRERELQKNPLADLHLRGGGFLVQLCLFHKNERFVYSFRWSYYFDNITATAQLFTYVITSIPG